MILIRKRLDIPQNGANRAIILSLKVFKGDVWYWVPEPQKKSGVFTHKFGINFDQGAPMLPSKINQVKNEAQLQEK